MVCEFLRQLLASDHAVEERAGDGVEYKVRVEVGRELAPTLGARNEFFELCPRLILEAIDDAVAQGGVVVEISE